MLEFRLKYLHNVVDLFVIVESTKTFTGMEKKLTARGVIEKLPKKIKDKVRLIEVQDAPYSRAKNEWDWQREYYQRNATLRGLTDLKDDDVLMICFYIIDGW